MARGQDRLTLLFAHLQNSPWRGSIPALLSMNQGWCSLHSPREGGLRAELLWKLRPGVPIRQSASDSEKMGQGQAGGWMWAVPQCSPQRRCRGNSRTESSLLQPPPLGSTDGDRHWFTLQGHNVHQAHVSDSQTPWAEPQLELKHIFTQVGKSNDIFSPPQMPLLIC